MSDLPKGDQLSIAIADQFLFNMISGDYFHLIDGVITGLGYLTIHMINEDALTEKAELALNKVFAGLIELREALRDETTLCS